MNDLEEIYGTAKLGDLALEPDLETLIAHSRNPDVLLFVWQGWRDVTGPRMREKYSNFVRLLNKGARENSKTKQHHSSIIYYYYYFFFFVFPFKAEFQKWTLPSVEFGHVYCSK